MPGNTESWSRSLATARAGSRRVFPALALLLLCGGCAWRPAGQTQQAAVLSAPGAASPGTIAVTLSLARAGRKLQFNGGAGALQNDFAHLVVGVFDNGNVASPSLGYLYRGAGGLVAGTVEALAAGGASWLLAPGDGIADKLGTAGTGAAASGLAITTDRANLRRYLIRHFGSGAAFVGGTSEVRFSNLPSADGTRHSYLVFAAAYDGADTNLGYTEAAVADNLSQGGSNTAAAQLTLHLKQGMFTKDLASSPSLVPFVPGAGVRALVRTLAGSGQTGFADGDGAAAEFNEPCGIAVDSRGNLFVADRANNRIRKITPLGRVTTYAGSGIAGSADGPAGSAQFNGPHGVALDASGSLYVSDLYGHRIRKVSAGGVVSTIAGDGNPDFADGNGQAARFYEPAGLALGPDGNLYVADARNYRVRKITPGGDVSTVAGGSTADFVDANGPSARFSILPDLVIDASGSLYVSDRDNHAIRKIAPNGDVTTMAGTGTAGFADGAAATAQFNTPHGLAIDARGDLIVADYQNHRIRRIGLWAASPVVETVAGTGNADWVDGLVPGAAFSSPVGLAIGKSGLLFISDYANRRIRVVQ